MKIGQRLYIADNCWTLSAPDIESLLTREAENITKYSGPYALVSGVFALSRGCTCNQSLESDVSSDTALHVVLMHESRTGQNHAPAHSHVFDSSYTREGVIRSDYNHSSREMNVMSSTSGGGPGYGAYEKARVPSAARATYQITTRRRTQPLASAVL